MKELESLLKERISNEGPMTFETFMEEALYHPGLGYYNAPETEIGRAGDFYTSSHLHPIFGAMLGRQAEEMWGLLGHPSEFTIVEAGGGRGWLAKDMLDYLRGRDIYDGLSYTLVELNPGLRKKQSGLLESHTSKVSWAPDLPDIAPFTGMILTNELFDAMPVHLVEMDGGSLKEIYIGLEDDRLAETKGELSSRAISEYFNEFGITLADGFRTEANLRMRNWLGSAAGILNEGFVLTIDYGYPARELYSPDRNRGTLMCYHEHQVNENPLINIGSQDITSHINFSALKKWGEELGLRTLGFTRQGPYLVSLGIDEVIADMIEDSPSYQSEINRIKGLILPGGMGDTHKALVQYKGKNAPELRGFILKNQADAL